MLDVFKKVIERIETLQESNAKMQFALRHLMGMDENSISDVAVAKGGFEKKGPVKRKKKKKNMKEGESTIKTQDDKTAKEVAAKAASMDKDADVEVRGKDVKVSTR